MKTRLLIIIGIAVASGAFGMVYLLPGVYDQNSLDSQNNNYEYEIQGDTAGAGPHTKKDLFLVRTNIDKSSDIHTVGLTKDLHYTDLIMFWDWQIYHFENYVFVSWVTSEQNWSDVFLATSDDYGKTFDVKNISQNRYYVSEYKIDFSDETVYVVWKHSFITENNDSIDHIYFTKSDNFGKSFGQQKLLSTFDKSSYEFDLEAFEDDVFVVWRQDVDLRGENNVWFATSTDKAEYFDREAKLHGARVDVDSHDDILHLTWVSVEDDDQVWYAYSEDLGQTLPSRIVFDADWKLSPYADRPAPRITIGEDITIEFEMDNEKGEKTPYKISIMDKNEN